MSILVFEFVSGGGFFELPGKPQPHGSLLREGLAMADSVCSDLAECELNSRVIRILDDRFSPALTQNSARRTKYVRVAGKGQLHDALMREAIDCEYAIVIAPEMNGHLRNFCRLIRFHGASVLSPPDEFLAWASDKTSTCERLAQFGIRTPCGTRTLGKPSQVPRLPCVVKPNDGAGSDQMHLVTTTDRWHELNWDDEDSQPRSWRVESYVDGKPASLAVACGPGGAVMLAPCSQRIDADGVFSYRGGQVMPDGALARRAVALGRKILPLLQQAIGYIGIDMILGTAQDGSEDVVVEINPRITTSYVGLSAACEGNLAEALIQISRGCSVVVNFPNRPLEFSADGKVSAAAV